MRAALATVATLTGVALLGMILALASAVLIIGDRDA